MRDWVRGHRRSWWLVAGGCVLVGCGGSDTVSPTSVTVATTVSVPPTTPTTTAVVSTSSTNTTSTSTTVPPTTTTPPATEADLKQALQDYFVAYAKCGEDPVACDPASFVAADSNALTQGIGATNEAARLNVVFGPDDGLSRLVPISIVFDSATQATTVSCIYDHGTELGAPGPDGQRPVLRRFDASANSRIIMRLQDGRWLPSLVNRFTEPVEGDQCPAV